MEYDDFQPSKVSKELEILRAIAEKRQFKKVCFYSSYLEFISITSHNERY